MNKAKNQRFFCCLSFHTGRGNPNKRGLSAIVATLIIILLAIVVFGIISVVVKKFVGESAEDIEFEAAAAGVDITIEKVVVGSLNVTLKRNDGNPINVTGIRFLLLGKDFSEVIEEEISINSQEVKTLVFDNSKLGKFEGKVDQIEKIGVYVGFKFKNKFRFSQNPSSTYPGPIIFEEEVAVCGDGICDDNETCFSCSIDCGKCGIQVELACVDVDKDGAGAKGTKLIGCSINTEDCNDSNPNIYPTNTNTFCDCAGKDLYLETANMCEDGIDQDCDGKDKVCEKKTGFLQNLFGP